MWGEKPTKEIGKRKLKGTRFLGESTTIHVQMMGPCTQSIFHEAPSRSCCSPQWFIFTRPFLIIALHSSFICSVFTCWSLPMGSISNYVDFCFPFSVWANQPQRGFVVHTTAHTEAGLQLELELLFSNICCWNGCLYHSTGHVVPASQTERLHKSERRNRYCRRAQYGKPRTGRK